MRSGKAYRGAALGIALLSGLSLIWWLIGGNREGQVLRDTSREVAGEGLVELVSVINPGDGGPLEVQLRARSESFDPDQLTVEVVLLVLSPSGYESASPARHGVTWGSWFDSVLGKEQLLLMIDPEGPFDRVEIELQYEGSVIDRMVKDWNRG